MTASSLKEAAEGSMPARNALVRALLDGYNAHLSPAQAFSWMRASALAHDPDATVLLARCYLGGVGVPVDTDRAVGLLRRAVNRAHPEACTLLAACFERGVGVGRNDGRAAALRQKGAALALLPGGGMNHGGSYVVNPAPADIMKEKSPHGGYMLRALPRSRTALSAPVTSRATPIPSSLAARHARHSVPLGDRRATFPPRRAIVGFPPTKAAEHPATLPPRPRTSWLPGSLVHRRTSDDMKFLHLDLAACIATISASIDAGKDLDLDEELAVRRVEDAADSGNRAAMFCFSRMYRYGKGVPKDHGRAAELMLKLKSSGYPNAIFHVAEYYELGIGLRRSDEKAAALYERAGKYGNVEAKVRLATMYETGRGVLRNMDRAAHLYLQADDIKSVLRVAHRYLSGVGERENASKAGPLYRYAAERGEAIAMFNLGCMYEAGNGVECDYRMAIVMYGKASDGGNVDAMVNLGAMYEEGLGVKQDLDKARLLYLAAMGRNEELDDLDNLPDVRNAGEICAMYNAARIYWRGLAVAKDIELALALFRRAAERGSEEATEFICKSSPSEMQTVERCTLRG